MPSLSTVDPQLERFSTKMVRIISEIFFQDPTISKLYHPIYPDESFFWKIRKQLLSRQKAKEIHRKYEGNFTTFDILNSNKLRLLFLNLGEMITLKNSDVFKQLKLSSTNLTRGFLQGYTMNLALYLGIHGVSSNNLKNSEFPLGRYLFNFMSLSILTYPLQYWTFQQFHFLDRARPVYSSVPEKLTIKMRKGERAFEYTSRDISFIKMRRCFVPFMVFSFLYGSSVAAYNGLSNGFQYLYYPGILLSAAALSAQGFFFRNIQKVNSFKGAVFLPYTTGTGFKNPINLGSVLFFVLLNVGFPLVIPQLRSKEEFRHEYFDYLEENKVNLFGQESAFQ